MRTKFLHENDLIDYIIKTVDGDIRRLLIVTTDDEIIVTFGAQTVVVNAVFVQKLKKRMTEYFEKQLIEFLETMHPFEKHNFVEYCGNDMYRIGNKGTVLHTNSKGLNQFHECLKNHHIKTNTTNQPLWKTKKNLN
jgi:hypothetical protein